MKAVREYSVPILLLCPYKFYCFFKLISQLCCFHLFCPGNCDSGPETIYIKLDVRLYVIKFCQFFIRSTIELDYTKLYRIVNRAKQESCTQNYCWPVTFVKKFSELVKVGGVSFESSTGNMLVHTFMSAYAYVHIHLAFNGL